MAGKYYQSVMMLLFYLVIILFISKFATALNTFLLRNLGQLFLSNQGSVAMLVIDCLITFLFSVFDSVLQIGVSLFFLNGATGRPFYVSDLLYGYFHNFRRSLSLSFVMSLLTFVGFAPLNLFWGYLVLTASDSEILILALVQVALLFVYVPLSLALSQTYFLALDFPELSAATVLKQSIKIMKGKKRQLFTLQLSFLPLFLLGCLSFGLGFLWIIPYQKMTLSLFYLEMNRYDQSMS